MTNCKPPQIKLQRPARPIHKSRELNITHCQRDHVKSIYIARNPSRVPIHTPSDSGSIGPKTTPTTITVPESQSTTPSRAIGSPPAPSLGSRVWSQPSYRVVSTRGSRYLINSKHTNPNFRSMTSPGSTSNSKVRTSSNTNAFILRGSTLLVVSCVREGRATGHVLYERDAPTDACPWAREETG